MRPLNIFFQKFKKFKKFKKFSRNPCVDHVMDLGDCLLTIQVLTHPWRAMGDCLVTIRVLTHPWRAT